MNGSGTGERRTYTGGICASRDSRDQGVECAVLDAQLPDMDGGWLLYEKEGQIKSGPSA